ncbi:MAG: hypothetical protein KAJ24_07375 [Candidatus Aenigmarchaeota archaeon]|nr:hypothetical protein [Candidatus Aenigmarchaeota archaeon]
MASFSIETYRNLIGQSPEEIQKFLNSSIMYDHKKASKIRAFYQEDNKNVPVSIDVLSLRTVPQVYEDRTAICHEAAIMAALLTEDSFNPGVLHLTSESVCGGHCICAYQNPKTELFGGVGFSRHEDLRERPATHNSIESLANSYLLHNLDEFFYKNLKEDLEQLKAIQDNKDYYNELILHLNI